MKVVRKNIDSKNNAGSYTIVPLNSEDIYLLNDIFKPNDIVEALSTRKISADGGKTQHKVTLKIAIKIESFQIDLKDCIVYLKGKTCKEYEHIKTGSYHTINLTLNEAFTITKDCWTSEDIRKIESSKISSPELCFVVFYDKDCIVSVVSATSINQVFKEEVKNKNIKNILKSVVKLKDNVKTFIICGFNEIKNELYNALIKENKAFEKMTCNFKLTPEYKGIPNTKVINKMITDKDYSKAFLEVKYIDDLKEMERFFTDLEMDKKGLCLGLKEIEDACEYGALKTLFITDRFYRPATIEERIKNDKIVRTAKELRAKICVIPISHELGEKLKKMGEIAGNLLFEYK